MDNLQPIWNLEMVHVHARVPPGNTKMQVVVRIVPPGNHQVSARVIVHTVLQVHTLRQLACPRALAAPKDIIKARQVHRNARHVALAHFPAFVIKRQTHVARVQRGNLLIRLACPRVRNVL